MLDLGTYPVALATNVLARLHRLVASGEDVPGGVNEQCSMLLSHPGGAPSMLLTSILGHTPGDAIISGTGGMSTIPGRFYTLGPFTLTANDPSTRLVYDEERNHCAQLFHQAIHLAICVREGRTESPVRSLSDSLLTLEVMDEARRRLGIAFREKQTTAQGRAGLG